MNRPPLQVPTAMCWRSGMQCSRIGPRHMADPGLQRRSSAADEVGVRVALTLSLLVFALLAPAAQAATGETRIIVGRDPGLTGNERAAVRRDAGVELLKT